MGCYSEAMGVAVIVRDKKLGLSIVAILNLRDDETMLQQAVSPLLEVGRRPVESYPLVVLRLTREPAR